MALTGLGTLTVRLFTAGGAAPVEGALVIISGADETNGTTRHSLITDVDGKTQAVELAAPLRANSLSPGSPGEIYSRYNVELSRDGYYSKIIRDVPVFAGVSATLPINMIPRSRYDNGDNLPSGETDALITENENLE